MEILLLKTSEKNQAIDITSVVGKALAKSGVKEGLCHVYCPHTTAAIAISEGTDETLVADLFSFLEKKVPQEADWTHPSNSAAHLKSVFIGPEKAIPVSGGRLALGEWQSVFLLEFDGPRERKVLISLFPKG